jgi:3-hydroxypropanoate dehydrogenase
MQGQKIHHFKLRIITMSGILTDTDFDILFRKARTHNRWDTARAVTDVQIQSLYELLKWGPTSANCSPARFVFVTSAASKEKLAGLVSAGNKIKVEQAPCTVIIGMDMKFYDRIPELMPHMPSARDWFAHDEKVAEATAFRNSTLQGAYLMLAARGLGLNCGPMSGFDAAAVDSAFFADTSIKSNFICALGTGTDEELYPRSPRLAFDDACKIV